MEKQNIRRCWGLTHNLRRCGRHGSWRLSCHDNRLQPIGWICFLVFTVMAGAASIQSAWFPHLWTKAAPVLPPGHPPTLLGLFKSDFASVMKLEDKDRIGVQWKSGDVLHINTQLYADFPAKAQFVGFYIPASSKTYEACLDLSDAVLSTIEAMQKHVPIRAGYRDEGNNLNDLAFSGRVLLYHETPLTIVKKAAIINQYGA